MENTYFIWTKEGYEKGLYCYYCKTEAGSYWKINKGGWGCDNCRNYAQQIKDKEYAENQP